MTEFFIIRMFMTKERTNVTAVVTEKSVGFCQQFISFCLLHFGKIIQCKLFANVLIYVTPSCLGVKHVSGKWREKWVNSVFVGFLFSRDRGSNLLQLYLKIHVQTFGHWFLVSYHKVYIKIRYLLLVSTPM